MENNLLMKRSRYGSGRASIAC